MHCRLFVHWLNSIISCSRSWICCALVFSLERDHNESIEIPLFHSGLVVMSVSLFYVVSLCCFQCGVVRAVCKITQVLTHKSKLKNPILCSLLRVRLLDKWGPWIPRCRMALKMSRGKIVRNMCTALKIKLYSGRTHCFWIIKQMSAIMIVSYSLVTQYLCPEYVLYLCSGLTYEFQCSEFLG